MFIYFAKHCLFSELLGLRPRLNTDQVRARLGLTSSDVSFTAQRYIDSLLLVADRIKKSCVDARVSCQTEIRTKLRIADRLLRQPAFLEIWCSLFRWLCRILRPVNKIMRDIIESVGSRNWWVVFLRIEFQLMQS